MSKKQGGGAKLGLNYVDFSSGWPKIANWKPVKPAKSKPKPKKVRAPTPDSSDSDEEVPRQKAVRRSAKTELKRQAGATEEAMLKKSKLVGNRHKAAAMEMDAEREFRMLGSQLMPGRAWD